MKKVLFGAAAALAIAAPASAFAEVRGLVDVSYANNDFEFTADEFQDYDLQAALIVNLTPQTTVQAEGRTTLQDWGGGESSHGIAAVHISTAVGDWDVGGYAGIMNFFGYGGAAIGAEARTAFGNISVDGSVSYASVDDNWYEGLGLRLGGSYFVRPNFAIAVGASQTELENPVESNDVRELYLSVAYQFAHDNVTLYGGYTNTDGDRSLSADYDGDTIQIGLRFNFNGGTLQENTNDGAWTSAMRFADTWKRW